MIVIQILQSQSHFSYCRSRQLAILHLRMNDLKPKFHYTRNTLT